MKFVNGNRTFIVDQKAVDSRGYYKCVDTETKVELYLPDYVISGMTFKFSWDTFREDRDEKHFNSVKVIEESMTTLYETSTNYVSSMYDIRSFMEDMILNSQSLKISSKLKGLL